MPRVIRILVLAATCALAACASLQDETKNWTPEQFYREAKERMTNGDWPTAIKYFEQLEARYPYGAYTEQAQLELAYVHHKDNEPALALAAADRFIRQHPTHPHVDYAYYLKGLINFQSETSIAHWMLGIKDEVTDRDQKSVRESYNSFRELIERFPNSRYAKDASERMAYLVHAQARYQVNVARFYFDRGAYVAAANRCKHALEDYPRTAATEEALGIQAKAYKLLGLTTLADDTVRVLRTNYPQSKYLKEIEELKS